MYTQNSLSSDELVFTDDPAGYSSETLTEAEITPHKAQGMHSSILGIYLILSKGELDWILIIPHINPLRSISAKSTFHGIREKRPLHISCSL